MYGQMSINDEVKFFDALQSLKNSFNNYRRLQGINSSFVMGGLFPYLLFSLTLASVISVLRLAKTKLLAYIIIFLTIMLGFGTAGFLIYGDQMSSFSSILRGSLEMMTATLGGIKYNEMKAIDPVVTPFFVFSYLIFAYTVFLKTFLLILQEEYNELFKKYVEVVLKLKIVWKEFL